MVANLNGASGLRDVSYTNLHLTSLDSSQVADLREKVQFARMVADLTELAVRNAEMRGQTSMTGGASGAPAGTAATLTWDQLYSIAPDAREKSYFLDPVPAGQQAPEGRWVVEGVEPVGSGISLVGAYVAGSRTFLGSTTDPVWKKWNLQGYSGNGFNLVRQIENDAANLTVSSLDVWRQRIEETRAWAAREESKLPPGVGASRGSVQTGGVQVHNGKWYVAGQEVTYDDVYFAVRVNQAANIDTNLNDYVGEIQKNNAKVKQANEFLSTLRTYKPTSTSATVSLSDLQKIRNSFSSLYGYDPSTRFDLKMTAAAGQTSFDTWIDTVKNAVSDLQSDNQTAQLKMERLNNQRSEVLEGLTSFTKGQSQTGASISRNVG